MTYALCFGGANGQGLIGDAILTITSLMIRSLQIEMQAWVMMAGILPHERTPEQQEEADYDYSGYKNHCSNTPNERDYPDKCSYLVAAVMHIKKCIKLNEDFDEKWTDNRHSGQGDKKSSLDYFKDRQKRLEETLQKECTSKAGW